MQKRLEGFPVDCARHPFHKVIDVRERAVGLAFLKYCAHDVVSEALDASETETYFSLLVHGEACIGLVDVRVEHLDAVLLAVVHDLLDLIHVGEILCQVGRLEFGRVVSLEPSGLVADPCIAGRV